MRIAFVSASSAEVAYGKELASNYSAIEPPTWALILASVAARNAEVSIFDQDALRESDMLFLQRVGEFKPELVIYVVYGQNPNSGTVSMAGAQRLAQRMAVSPEFQGVPLAIVGSHASALPYDVARLGLWDIVFINDGMKGVEYLANGRLGESLRNCPGVLYREAGRGEYLCGARPVVARQDELDLLAPDYPWELLSGLGQNPLSHYRAHLWHTNFTNDRSPFAALYTSLGCAFKCNFCMINIVNRDSYDDAKDAADFSGMRYWSVDKVLRDFDRLAQLGVKNIRISDEMFFLNKKYYVPILQGLIDRKYNFNLWAYARIDSVRPEQLALFKAAGVNWLCLGIEAGNRTVRQEVEKGKFHDVDIRRIVSDIKDSGINVLGNFIFGFPEDDMGTMQETLDLALELNCEHANFYCAAALPGSPLYNQAKANGWYIPREFGEYGFLSYDTIPLQTNYVKAEDVLRFRDEAWQRYFTSDDFLSLVAKKFGDQALANVKDLAKIKLKRKLLGHGR